MRANVRITRTDSKRDRIHSKHAREDVRWSTHNGGWFPKVSIGKTHEPKEGRGAGTYVHVAFYVPNQDEVSRTGVADVGVDGD